MNTILFDIDGTIFDSRKFLRGIWDLYCAKFNIPVLKLRETIDSYYFGLENRTKFNPGNLVGFISRQFDIEYDLLWKIFWDNKNLYENAIYYDTIDALNFAKKNFNVGTYSQGFFDLQKHKLEMIGVLGCFNPELLFITVDKSEKKFLKTLPKNSIIVENAYEVVEKLGDFNPVWINRNSDENDPKIPTIHSLTELPQLLF